MVKKIIVNADDFGLSEAVTLGILRAHKDGLVNSTTVMMNMDYALEALNLAKSYPDLKIGVHLNGTLGKPLTDGKSLAYTNGKFMPRNLFPENYPIYDLEDLYIEWKAQIDRYIEYTGKKPTHLDSHHHLALKNEDYLNLYLRLAKEYDVPVRLREDRDERFEFVRGITIMFDELKDRYKELFEYDEEIIEVMCHPGYVDHFLYTNSSYSLKRMEEVEFYTSKELKEYFDKHQFSIIGYDDVKKRG